MISASGVRIGWADLPQRVRGAVEAILGASLVEAVSQPGGFSPGTADRVRTADGVRAFVKAVSPEQNGDTPNLHRREGGLMLLVNVRLFGGHDTQAMLIMPRVGGKAKDPIGQWVTGG